MKAFFPVLLGFCMLWGLLTLKRTLHQYFSLNVLLTGVYLFLWLCWVELTTISSLLASAGFKTCHLIDTFNVGVCVINASFQSLICAVLLQVVNRAGHHIYADRPELFNNIVTRTCDMIDQPGVIPRPLYPSVVKVQRIGPAMNGLVPDLNKTPSTDSDEPVTSDS